MNVSVSSWDSVDKTHSAIKRTYNSRALNLAALEAACLLRAEDREERKIVSVRRRLSFSKLHTVDAPTDEVHARLAEPSDK